MALKLRRNETFYIREGWFEKAINTIHEKKGINIFSKNEGTLYLGIGSNMVKGLKYWLIAAGVIDTKNGQLTEFGSLLQRYDPYLDSAFSWYLIHCNLASNSIECPVQNYLFNSDKSAFTRDGMSTDIETFFRTHGEVVKKSYIDQDLNVILKSYVFDPSIHNPEDNYSCPLSELGLITQEVDRYYKQQPRYADLSCMAVYYALIKHKGITDEFNIDDSIKLANSPVPIFNLDRYTYQKYLDDLAAKGLLEVHKTAGLNTAKVLKRLSLDALFEMVYEG